VAGPAGSVVSEPHDTAVQATNVIEARRTMEANVMTEPFRRG